VTEPVEKVSRSREVAGKNRRETGLLQREKSLNHQNGGEVDSIDISDEARDRAAGRKRRSILEYINDETGEA
jgi:hypothetical protein